MDAIQMIRDDHRRVETLFRDFEEANPQTRKAIFDNIYVELDVHASLEEEIFYPSVQRMGEREIVRHAEEEHGLVKQLLNEMVEMDPKDPTFEAKFRVLKDNVKDHVAEEEAEMLPKAAEAGMSRLIQLGEEMERRKQQLMSATNGRRRTATTPRRRGSTTRPRTSTGRSTTARKSTTSRSKASTARKTTTLAKAGTKASTARKTTTSRSRTSSGRARSSTSPSGTTSSLRTTANRSRTTTSRSRATAGGSRSTARARTTARGGSTRSKTAGRRSGTRSGASR